MSPNLFLVCQRLVQPHKWFQKKRRAPKAKRTVTHRDSPIPGTYEHIPGRGLFLTATDSPAEKLPQPIAVKHSRVLHRWLLQPDYDARKRYETIKTEDGKLRDLVFFRLDDGIAWVNYVDHHGDFIYGPYKLWVIDEKTNNLRPMIKRDDPDWRSRNSKESALSLRIGQSSRGPSPPPSRGSYESRAYSEKQGSPTPLAQEAVTAPCSHCGSVKAFPFPTSQPTSCTPSIANGPASGPSTRSSSAGRSSIEATGTLPTSPSSMGNSVRSACDDRTRG